MLTDAFQRQIEYLRISLTDKCNLRCRYCVPPDGVKLRSHEDILSLEEMLRVVSLMTDMGVKRVRFTGGEPLIRKNALGLIRDVASLPSHPMIAMTTNGVFLPEYIDDLYEAGLRDINISLDTLRADVYEMITGSDDLGKVLRSIDMCLDKGMNVKINVVPLQGINEDDLEDLAQMARTKVDAVRFIELMPIGCANAYKGLSNDDVKERLKAIYGVGSGTCDPGIISGPAEYVTYEGFKGKVGFISPLSHKFCDRCNRIRLTCDGRLRLCLASDQSIDLKTLLRSGASDETIKEAITEGVKGKNRCHGFNDRNDTRSNMIGIGG